MRRIGCAFACAALALAAGGPPSTAAATPRVLIALVGLGAGAPARASLLGRFAADPRLAAFGLLGASLGNYNELQTLLDITQSARVPFVDYTPRSPAPLTLEANGTVLGWPAELKRARGADASIEPGLLASQIPGGSAYAAIGAKPGIDALLAADRRGHVAAVSLGGGGSLLRRIRGLLATRRLVVADLSSGALGLRELNQLLASRSAGELVIGLERPPRTSASALQAPALLAIATSSIGSGRGALRTATTRIDGLVTTLDLAPTILDWLDLREPSAFVGQRITVGAPRSAAALSAFAARLKVIGHRRTPAIAAFLIAWLALLASAAVLWRRAGLARALRLGGLAALWAPTTILMAAALEPSEAVEIAVIVGGAFALGFATDRLARWPRGPAIPAAVGIVLYSVDLARGSPLIVRSLLGPNPISGARFFGVGNELSAVLPILLFAGLAAALPQRPASRRDAARFAAAGALVTLICSWGPLGANVGAIFTVGVGSVVATILLVPGRISARRVALAVAVPLVGLGLLAALDLASGGGAQYTREVVHADSLAALIDTLGRRLREAWLTLRGGATALAVLAALAVAAALHRLRAGVLAPVAGANAWGAALAGGFAGALVGSIANDSGARLLLVGCFALVCVLAYIRGAPAPTTSP